MSTGDQLERTAEPSLGPVPGRANPTKIYGGDALPPGAVPVAKRVLARWVPPGTRREPHGVPPIGDIELPAGLVLAELFDEGGPDEVRVLPFRFPWYSRAYALRGGEPLCAVFRNVEPTELGAGTQVVVQFNDARDWTAVFGTIEKLELRDFKLRLPDGELRDVNGEQVHFIGKVVAWWDDEVPATPACEPEPGDGFAVYEVEA
jgi:hypothetical protein